MATPFWTTPNKPGQRTEPDLALIRVEAICLQ
jgi:hypothetical protein